MALITRQQGIPIGTSDQSHVLDDPSILNIGAVFQGTVDAALGKLKIIKFFSILNGPILDFFGNYIC